MTIYELNAKLNPIAEVYAIIKDGQVIGNATLLIEPKLIHGGCKVAHIEDVWVSELNRKSGVGSELINKLIEVAKEYNCYKVILNCNTDNIPFYEKLGFKQHEVEMRLDL